MVIKQLLSKKGGAVNAPVMVQQAPVAAPVQATATNVSSETVQSDAKQLISQKAHQ